MELWLPLEPDFPDYSISSLGQVQNNTTGRILAQSMNTTGYMKIAMNDFRGHRRTVEVTRLVALYFVEGYDNINNTPIHLDGNREHTWASNLAWRPRWFATQYHRQFSDRRNHIASPLVEMVTSTLYRNSLEAAVRLGLLEQHIVLSVANGTTVYPGGYQFQLNQ